MEEEQVLSVHFGRSANCSSIGSMVDFLFVSTVAGAAIVSALAVALAQSRDEPQTPASDGDQASEDEPEQSA